MSQSAVQVSAGTFLDGYDFNQNYKYLKMLIQELKAENGSLLRKEIFGEESQAKLTKKQMKQLFRFLRKVENHYDACCTPPIPEELEQGIRSKDPSNWLPWEQEAIQKVDIWRAALQEQKAKAREMLRSTLEKVRRGETVN
jgi:hypothetical protein